jgi:predicted nucleotidyltransferase
MKRIEVETRTILLTLTGSRLYRVHNEDSDYDYKGICIPTLPYFIGTQNFEQLDRFVEPTCLYPALTDTDSNIYNIKKFCHLATLNNPNILELLWIDRSEYLVLTSFGESLIEIRDAFLSQKVFYSYSGYAQAQIKKVQTHRKWLLRYTEDPNFLSAPPIPQPYGVSEHPLRKEQLNAFLEFLYILIKDASQYSEVATELLTHVDYKGLLKQYPLAEELLPAVQYYTRSTNDFVTLLHNTQTYRQALQEYEAFQSWRKNRNSKRAEIEEKVGYDSKHSGHCYRLLKSGIEILNGEGVIPNREITGDAEFIRQIRNGEIPYDTLIAEVEKLTTQLAIAMQNTKLPKYPDQQAIEEKQMEIIKAYLEFK